MSTPLPFPPATLFMGVLFAADEPLRGAVALLRDDFGPLEWMSCPRIFSETSYYEREMGSPLFRLFMSFRRLFPQEDLAAVKERTNEIERLFLQGGRRTINVDPGVLSEERLILATGKNAAHRIPLRGGIYAEVTLIYHKGCYQPLAWTYPDYRDPRLLHFLGVLRRVLVMKRRGEMVMSDGGS